MTLKRGIVVVSLLAITGTCWAGSGGLKPREPIPKSPAALLSVPDDATGRLIIKFADYAMARLERDGYVHSLTDRSMSRINDVIDRFGLTLKPAINHPPELLAQLEQRAADYSSRAQPDLAGMMHIEGPQEALLPAARALYQLDTVEFVTFETKRYLPDGTAGPQFIPAGRATGACCIPNEEETVFACTEDTPGNCLSAGGVYQGDNTVCGADGCKACCLDDDTCEVMVADSCAASGGNFVPDEPNCEDVDCDESDCGGTGTGLCWDENNANVACSDLNCCETVCGIDPFCCDDQNEDARWDDFCVAEANMLCAGHTTNGNPAAPDKCNTPLNHSCFASPGYGGCNNEVCCELVVALDPSCAIIWHSGCVDLAYDNCTTVSPDGSTPDFTSLQGYRTLAGYISQLGDIPPEYTPFLPDTFIMRSGYGGEGWYLFDEDDEYGGLYGVGQQLLDAYGIDGMGEGNLGRGKTINVAVMEWAYYPDHEDLDVISEPGQTLILEPEWLTNPDHGTACLGIINAVENDRGVTGLAPDAQAYFFPLTSVEEGPRELTAWTSALLTFEPGDVISASYGTGGTLNTELEMWTMISLANDLGISVCMSAGNDCVDLSGFENYGDSGGTVVGACSPGFPYYRLDFSNFYTGGNWRAFGDGNVVHVAAWGDAVATTGYGEMFSPNDDHERDYTATFDGTSAAAPQIAGLTACLQGLAKQFYGIPVRPMVIRMALDTGCPNAGKSQGNWSGGGRRFVGGFDDPGGDCALDTDIELGPFYIGPDESGDRLIYPRLVGDPSAVRYLLTSAFAGFDDSPLIDDVVVLRGDRIFGNKYSVKGRDDSYLVVEAMYTSRGDSPDPPGGGGGGGGGGGQGVGWLPEMGQVQYLASGDITDVAIVGHADIPGVNSMAMESEMSDPGVFTLVFVEAYDWIAGRWSFVDVVWMNGDAEGDGDFYFVHTASSTQRFVRESDDRILFRMWTLGFSLNNGGIGDSGGQTIYRQKLDWVNILVDEDFGEELP